MRLGDRSRRWPLERVLFALAGTINQWLYVLVGACPASIVLSRACHLRSAIYSNPKSDKPAVA